MQTVLRSPSISPLPNHSVQRTVIALITLRGCAGLSGSSLSAYAVRLNKNLFEKNLKRTQTTTKTAHGYVPSGGDEKNNMLLNGCFHLVQGQTYWPEDCCIGPRRRRGLIQQFEGQYDWPRPIYDWPRPIYDWPLQLAEDL